MINAEYDAFGPWIDEISAPSDVPRLYRDFPLDLAACRVVLKFPRNVSRRDVTPDMDLYDHLLVAGPEKLTVLSRQGDSYSTATAAYDRIVAIEDSVSLLDGLLTVHTVAEGSVSIPFNGSSHEVVETLIDLLRELSGSTVPAARRSAPVSAPRHATLPTPGLVALGDKDVDLVSSFRHLQRSEPDVRLLAAHGRLVLAPRGGAVSRGMHSVRPMVLQGALVCRNETELQVISRRDWLVRGNRPVHSLARTVVTLAKIDAVSSRQDAEYTGVRVVTVRAGATSIDFPVPADSEAERILLSLAPAAA